MNKERPSFIKKQFERATYLFLLFSLAIGAFVATILTYLNFLIPKKKKKKDFLFFPYAPKNNIGSISRFQIFLPFLERDGYTYDIDYLYEEQYYLSITHLSENRIKQYLLLHRIFWHRLFKTLTAGNYKAVFIQRAMFPEYYGQTFSYLERLMSRLNDNITIDFYDAEYARNKKLTDSSVSFCDKVCVVNKHLYQYFSKIHKQVYYNNLAVDASHYLIKENYALHNPVKIFWTGSVVNAQNLKNIIPILEKLNKEIPLKLLMICPTNAGYTSPVIERLNWERKTFFRYLADADIAIYPALENTEFTRGKVAFKTMEYFSAKVPVIASPFGLSHYFEDGKDVLIAGTDEEWEAAFRKLIADESLRKEMVGNAYQKLMQYHDVDATYENFVKVLLS